MPPRLHLLLERVDVPLFCAGDNEIVDVHADDHRSSLRSARVEGVLGGALGEAERREACVQLDVPRARPRRR